MEIAFEINPRQARQNAVDDQRLAQPNERGSNQRSQQDDAGEVEQESGRVFQGC